MSTSRATHLLRALPHGDVPAAIWRAAGIFLIAGLTGLSAPAGTTAAQTATAASPAGATPAVALPRATRNAIASPAIATHGIAMHGEPAFGADFKAFPYVDAGAPKGGQLRLGVLGSFDTMNPFIIKGSSANGLREYVYESLLVRSADEPFALYGLIAERIETPPDRSSVTFHLRPEARFSDGQPITSADVAFSRSILAEKGWPYHRSYYRKVVAVETPDAHTIRFQLGSGGDRELPLILALMPVLPKHKITAESFERTTLDAPIGSGPYTVARIDAGRSVVYRRNPMYWGRDLAVAQGRFNVDEILFQYYRDGATLFEAFKSGDVDVRIEDDPQRWAEGYGFPAVRDGRVIRQEVVLGLPAGMNGIAFNTRRPPFDDQRVRRAFIQLFDADWINRNLYNGLYRRTDSYFARSELASTDRPADATERALLAPFPDVVAQDVLEGRWRPPSTGGSGSDRTRLAAANALLIEAGFIMRSGRMVEAKSGKPLAIEFLAASRGQERLMIAYGESLKRLGIGLRIRQVDSAQYWSRMKSYDFDLAQWTWSSSLSPGNEQLNRWSSRAADTEGTLNYPGVRSKAADAMIEALLGADTRERFVSAVRALDRVLLSGDYVIPLFYAPAQWVAYSKRLGRPARAPLAGTDFDTWWVARTQP